MMMADASAYFAQGYEGQSEAFLPSLMEPSFQRGRDAWPTRP